MDSGWAPPQYPATLLSGVLLRCTQTIPANAFAFRIVSGVEINWSSSLISKVIHNAIGISDTCVIKVNWGRFVACLESY